MATMDDGWGRWMAGGDGGYGCSMPVCSSFLKPGIRNRSLGTCHSACDGSQAWDSQQKPDSLSGCLQPTSTTSKQELN